MTCDALVSGRMSISPQSQAPSGSVGATCQAGYELTRSLCISRRLDLACCALRLALWRLEFFNSHAACCLLHFCVLNLAVLRVSFAFCRVSRDSERFSSLKMCNL